MGTQSGLNRYDGHRFIVFRHEEGRSDSLSSDMINALLVDRRGVLWVGTPWGVHRIDPESLVIRRITGIAGADLLVEDHEGNVWIGGEGGLSFLPNDWNPGEEPRFRAISEFGLKSSNPALLRAYRGCVDHQGALWIWSDRTGLHRLRSTGPGGSFSLEDFPSDPRAPGGSLPNQARALAVDPSGALWVGGNSGLYYCEPDRGYYRRYTHEPGDPASMGSSDVFWIHIGEKGVVWVANDGGGLSRMLPRAHPQDPPRFQRFQHDPRDPHSLSANGLQFIFEDRSQVLWVSAYQAGLNKLVLNPAHTENTAAPSLFQYRNNPMDPGTLTGNMVAAIGEDRFGNLWIGTDGSGLNRMKASQSPKEGMRFERFRAQPGKPGALQGDVVLAIHRDPKGQLWMGTYNAGLIRVDQASADGVPRFTHFKAKPQDPSSLAINFIWCILDDGPDRLWLGTNNHGLVRFDTRSHEIKRYYFGSQDKPGMWSSDAINAMVKDAYGTLWLATPDGLNRFNPVSGECRGYVPGGPNSLSARTVITLHIEPAGTLWIGTSGGGLNQTVIPPWEGPEPVFQHYDSAQGLPERTVKSILESEGQLWLSTDRSLYRFDPKTGRGHPFTWQRELSKAEFIKNAGFRSPSGELFFGSNDGLTLFRPSDIIPNPIVPPVAITDFQVLNQSISLQSRLREVKGEPRLILLPGDVVIAFDFAALHFASPERNQYAYMLEGVDPTWREAGTKHSLSYSTLPPGEYVLRVRASNSDGLWNETGLNLKIEVLPPWYQTWWFRGTLAVLLAASVYLFIWIRLRFLRGRNRMLEEMVSQRTHELREANESLENQSLTDPLTGLRNRRFLYEMLPRDIAQTMRVHRDVAADQVERMKLNIDILIIMVDIDRFKSINDRYGHHIGDLVLQQVSGILGKAVRETDTVVRWGGEEFIVIAKNTARADASLLPSRIRSAVEEHPFHPGEGEPLRCTCSIGFCVFPLFPRQPDRHTWEQIIDIADFCLLAAKENGRNAWIGVVPNPDSQIGELDGDLRATLATRVREGSIPILSSIDHPIQW